MKRKFIWWLGFISLFVLFSMTAFGDDWPTYHRDFQRGGASPASVDQATLTLDWFFTPGVGNGLTPGLIGITGSPVASGGQSPVVAFGKVFYTYCSGVDNVFLSDAADELVCLN